MNFGLGIWILKLKVGRMLLRFYSYEEACLFCAMKRSEGYFAEVIHDNFGHVYGHMVANGFAVIISEEVAPEGVTVPVPERKNPLLDELGKMAGMCAIVGMLGGGLLLLFMLAPIGIEFTKLPDSVLLEGLVLIAVLFCFLWGSLMLTRIYNRPKHPLYWVSRFIIKGILCVMILSYVPVLFELIVAVLFSFVYNVLLLLG